MIGDIKANDLTIEYIWEEDEEVDEQKTYRSRHLFLNEEYLENSVSKPRILKV